MNAAILSVGDELVLGTTLDTNSQLLARRLRDLGFDTLRHMTVGDDRAAITEALRELAAMADVVICTGGLGPTDDDLTRDALNELTDSGSRMVEDAERLHELQRWFRSRGRAMPAINIRQAMRPRSARTLPNPNGTAPGLAAACGRARIFCLPGPPSEMEPMFSACVVPQLTAAGVPPIVQRAVHCFGLGESQVAERLGARMMRGRQPTVGTTASQSVVSIQILSRGPTGAEDAAREARECNALLAPYSLGESGESLAQAVLQAARGAGVRVAVAESCTAGLVGAALATVPGSSETFVGGWTTYSNQMKERELGVPPQLLATHGAVSRECACAMADGAARGTDAGLAVAVTGIAGPSGGTADKPVGTVWVAVKLRNEAAVATRFSFPGDRTMVRDRAAKSALQLARWTALGVGAPLLWERP